MFAILMFPGMAGEELAATPRAGDSQSMVAASRASTCRYETASALSPMFLLSCALLLIKVAATPPLSDKGLWEWKAHKQAKRMKQ